MGYNNAIGEVEARNVARRMGMSAEERRNSLAEETEDVSRKDQLFIMDNLGVSAMGSRVEGRMAEIGKHFENQSLSEAQRAVVDVFSGARNNLTIKVKTKDGNRAVVMRQGTENKAGAKHSLFRHYDTGVGTITADDIALIPEVIAYGELKEKKRGKTTLNEYKQTINGVDYTVLTEVDSRREVFADFYTNKKTLAATRSTHSEEARDTAVNVSADKVSKKSLEKQAGVRFRVEEDYVPVWGEGESYAEAEGRLNRKATTLGIEQKRLRRRQSLGKEIDEARLSEVEAELAQVRKDLRYLEDGPMKPELAEETEDVSRKDQIFIMDGLGVSAMVEESGDKKEKHSIEDSQDLTTIIVSSKNADAKVVRKSKQQRKILQE